MYSDGTGLINLSNNPFVDNEPSWSPDRTKIVFASNRDSYVNNQGFKTLNEDIFSMNSDGSNVINLTNRSQGRDVNPSWSPDGTEIVFASDRHDGIYKMDSDGSNERWLGVGGGYEPAWSPDGTKIAFEVGGEYGAPRSIVIGSPDGGILTTLTGEYNGIDRSPAWSPDGSKIAFSSSQNDIHDDAEIWVMNSDGTNQIRLTSHPTRAYAPTWSPDGSQIAFWSDYLGNDEIFIVNADNGSNPINVTNDSPGREPSWSR